MQTVGHKPLDNVSVYKKTLYIKLCLKFLYRLQIKPGPPVLLFQRHRK